VKSFNISIEHNCPQCGAPVSLEETDRLFACPFCRVKSFLPENGYFRYVLPCPDPATGQPDVYFPYWRFKGTLCSSNPAETVYRFIDISHQGTKSDIFPVSLGFRTQALKLKFALPETPGIFIKPDLSPDDLVGIAEKRFSVKKSGTPLLQSFIGDTTSIIYSPFHVKEKLWDAVLNKPVSGLLPGDFKLDIFRTGKPDWTIDFVPAICPDCGWDLTGESDSLILLCKNCDSAWQPAGKKIGKINFGHILEPGEDILFLPFWHIKADISGISLNSYADLAKIANLPKVVRDEWKNIDFRFWIPAFKIRAQHFIRLATHMTLAQPGSEIRGKVPDGRIHPVNLPVTEAIESFKTVMAGFIKPKKEYFPLLPDVRITPENSTLVYVPFEEGHHDLIQPEYQMALNKALLATAGNL
jgi:DNA-directed RNA polymerase subunit RPC12/RpoP